MQGMVGRSELAAALAAAKARGEEAQAKADMVEGLEAQLARLREQLRDAQASLSETVPRTELTAALAKLGEATAKLAAAEQAAEGERERHQAALGKLKEAVELKEAEASSLRDRVQVRAGALQPLRAILHVGARECERGGGYQTTEGAVFVVLDEACCLRAP